MSGRYLLLFAILTSSAAAQPEKKKGPERFEKDIVKFEQRIADGSSKTESIMFLGSSSIRLWDLKKSFPGHDCINHGFGGSEISDSIHFFDRIVTPLRPSLIFVYAGDNDIGKGKSAETVHTDFRAFVKLVKQKTPEANVAFIAIKPSLKRWQLSSEMAKANEMIAGDCSKDESLTYVDIWHPMLNEEGTPRAELFVKDGLHLNNAGYELWNEAVAAVLPTSN